ncbi:MAG: UDP-glucose 4-epimerase GalE [Cyanobacteriota bacterium]
MANLLITGGGGFIGSHTTLCLLTAGHNVVVLDSFVNSDVEALRRVAQLANLPPLNTTAPGTWQAKGGTASGLTVLQGDVRRAEDVERAMAQGPVDAVLHFAGLKALAESIREPLLYWDVNVNGSRCLVETMQRHRCRTLIFSSSATLYGYPATLPIAETAPVQPLHPYGHTKAAVEQMLADLSASEPGWRIARLRYFNPVGAHPSGLIGEDPRGVPNNLFPLIGQVALGQLPSLPIFGNDWPTSDGSGVRDFIHVMDLAEGHGSALNHLLTTHQDIFLTLNLGSGQGISVLEMVRAYGAVSGQPIPHEVLPRRGGDAACSVADPSLAKTQLGWSTRRTLADICRDGWRWHSSNPRGYGRGDNANAVATPPPRPAAPEAAGENHPSASPP